VLRHCLHAALRNTHSLRNPPPLPRLRPASTPDIAQEDWLNVFVLHQNRVQHGPQAKNCLQERHLPAFLDLVVWGHEHECIPALAVREGGGVCFWGEWRCTNTVVSRTHG